MKYLKYVLLISLILLFFKILFYKTLYEIVSFPDGNASVTVFEIYNQEYKRKELIITPGKFEFDGLTPPSDYVKILFEGGFIFEVLVIKEGSMIYVKNCGGASHSNNIKLMGSGGIISIIKCNNKECCLNQNDTAIKISQNCSRYICW